MPLQDEQQTTSQHPVPQNIMDVEFKLIGDLTMRQFIYLLVFGILAWAVFQTTVGIFRIPLTLFFVGFGLALAFVPIQERGMDEWAINFIRAVYSPTQMVWKKEPVLPPAFTHESLAVVKQEMITLAPTSSRRKLEDYLSSQEEKKEVDRLDIPEKEYILKVRQAFAPTATEVALEEELAETKEFEAYKPYEQKPEKPQATPEKHLQEKPEKPGKERDVEKGEEEKPQPEPVKTEKEKEKEKAPEIKTTVPKKRPKRGRVTTQVRSSYEEMAYEPITPDMHVGRKFTSTLPSQGQLVLPVRGEKVIATSEEIDIQEDIEEKTSQLRRLLEQVQKEQGLDSSEEIEEPQPSQTPQPPQPAKEPKKPRVEEKTQPPPPPQKQKEKKDVLKEPAQPRMGAVMRPHEKNPDKSSRSFDLDKIREGAKQVLTKDIMPGGIGAKGKDGELEEAKQVVKEVKKENERLANEIQKLKNEVNQSDESEEEKKRKRDLIRQLEQEKENKNLSYSALQKQILELQKRIEEKEAPKKKKEASGPKFAKMDPITNEPNIVSGVVKDHEGKSIPGAVLLIKNHRGEAVRALKTNALGQFSISTPLVDGMYTVEVGSSIEGNSFDIITIEVKGEVIPPIELVGREV